MLQVNHGGLPRVRIVLPWQPARGHRPLGGGSGDPWVGRGAVVGFGAAGKRWRSGAADPAAVLATCHPPRRRGGGGGRPWAGVARAEPETSQRVGHRSGEAAAPEGDLVGLKPRGAGRLRRS